MKRQIIDSICENLTDSDLESKQFLLQFQNTSNDGLLPKRNVILQHRVITIGYHSNIGSLVLLPIVSTPLYLLSKSKSVKFY